MLVANHRPLTKWDRALLQANMRDHLGTRWFDEEFTHLMQEEQEEEDEAEIEARQDWLKYQNGDFDVVLPDPRDLDYDYDDPPGDFPDDETDEPFYDSWGHRY